MFTKNVLLWFLLMLALLTPLHILLIVAYLHCMSVLCSLFILLSRILSLLTISYPSSFNHSAIHPNLSLALLFFSLAIAFLTISSVVLSIWFVFLIIFWTFLFIFSSIILSLSLSGSRVFGSLFIILYILVYLIYFPI